MNKSEFTRAYADKLGVTIKVAEKNLALFIETLTDCLKNGEYVHVSGFATFDLKELQNKGFTIREIEILTGVSKSQVARELKEDKDE